VKRIVRVALALLAAALLVSALRIDAGYVGISFMGVLIEMSVATLLLVALAGYFLLWLLIRLVRVRKLRQQAQTARREQRARMDFARAILEYAAGNWEGCEKAATRSVQDAQRPIINYLLAARAAALLGAPERSAHWLKLAGEADPEEVTPVLVSRAELELKNKQFEAASETLQQLEASGKQNPRGLLLQARLYRQLGEFDKLRALEPKLRRAPGIRPMAVDEVMDQAYLEMLKATAENGDMQRLKQAWKETSRPAAKRPDVILAYTHGAMKCGDHAEAERVLREHLDEQWDESLGAAYGELVLPGPLEPLAEAEKWLRARPEDPALLVACARLCLRAELYGKARSYLETSRAVKRQPVTCQLLGNLLEQLGEHDRAVQVLNEGLALAIGQRANLPKIKQRRYQARTDAARWP
jgi:HemY protein